MNAVLDPAFWRERLLTALRHQDPRQSVFKTVDPETWNKIDEAHRAILTREVDPAASILDLGCGYGRLLELMPVFWRGDYLGVDLSPDFVAYGRQARPQRKFISGDFRTVDVPGLWDLGIFCSVRGMLEREVPGTWDGLLARARGKCRKILLMEYDPADVGIVLKGDAE